MSKKDTVTKAFMRENTVFADAFNYLIFNGKKVIQPERLQELDTTELVQLIAKGKNNKNESVQKYRDILKAAVIMEDENADYLLLGIENQTEIHYAMPVRNMIYDALQYGNQVAAIAAQNVKEKKADTRRISVRLLQSRQTPASHHSCASFWSGSMGWRYFPA